MISRTTLAALTLTLIALGMGSCSINGSRALGDDCLQNRECASGLSCQPRTDGRFVCQPINDASVFTVPDTGSGDSSSVDAGEQDASSVE